MLTELIRDLAELKALLAENCVLVDEWTNVHVHLTLTLDEYRRLVGDDPPEEAWDRKPRPMGEISAKNWDDAESEWHETREGGLPE